MDHDYQFSIDVVYVTKPGSPYDGQPFIAAMVSRRYASGNKAFSRFYSRISYWSAGRLASIAKWHDVTPHRAGWMARSDREEG